jgi:hypothetical protein
MLNHRVPVLLLVFIALLACSVSSLQAGAAEETDLARTAPELRDLWLRFHETELCQGLDTIFVFLPRGIEIWCLIEDERSFDRLKEMIEPLRAKFAIAVYLTRPVAEKRSPEDRDPPPSLWNNMELRAYLSDPLARSPMMEMRGPTAGGAHEAELQLKQRMTLFAEQTLEWDRRIKHFGSEIPELIRLAADSSTDAPTRARARSVSIAHAQELERYAVRVTDYLTQAFPRPKVKPGNAGETRTETAGANPFDSALRLSASAAAVAQRVLRFIHPRSHTVPISDLKEPSLLESLRLVRRQSVNLQRILSASTR